MRSGCECECEDKEKCAHFCCKLRVRGGTCCGHKCRSKKECWHLCCKYGAGEHYTFYKGAMQKEWDKYPHLRKLKVNGNVGRIEKIRFMLIRSQASFVELGARVPCKHTGDKSRSLAICCWLGRPSPTEKSRKQKIEKAPVFNRPRAMMPQEQKELRRQVEGQLSRGEISPADGRYTHKITFGPRTGKVNEILCKFEKLSVRNEGGGDGGGDGGDDSVWPRAEEPGELQNSH
jgi:hypothetical protein